MASRRKANERFDTVHVRGRLKELLVFLQRTLDELPEESKVRKGYIEEMKIANAGVTPTEATISAKRRRVE